MIDTLSVRQAHILHKFSDDAHDGGFTANQVRLMYGAAYKHVITRLLSAGLIEQTSETKRGKDTEYQITDDGYRAAMYFEKLFSVNP